MVDDYPYALASDFAVNRILKEAPESFHKLDNDDVIQVYMDLFGTDPADDMGMNRGGMMNINRMTAPLGYYRRGVPGDPELYEGYDPILGDWMKSQLRPAQPPAGNTEVDKARELGKKGLKGIKSLLRQIGAKEAEGSTLADSAMDMRILGMKLELQKILSLDMIDKMEEMGPIEIEILYDETFGK